MQSWRPCLYSKNDLCVSNRDKKRKKDQITYGWDRGRGGQYDPQQETESGKGSK